MNKMATLSSIKQWAEDDRPREKLIQKGRTSVSNSELLAILLGSGTRELSALELARQILEKADFKLSRLSRFTIEDLMKFKGVGAAKAVSIFASMELARRKSEEGNEELITIRSSKDVYHYLKPWLTDLSHEEFYVVFLNRANKIIGRKQISKGGISGTVVDGKIVFRHALEVQASAIILAHNHPSNQRKPSTQDIRLTKKMIEFGKMIDLQVIDHLIFCDNNYFSFLDEGII